MSGLICFPPINCGLWATQAVKSLWFYLAGKKFLRPQASVINMLAKKSNIITVLYYKWQGCVDDPYYGRPRVRCFQKRIAQSCILIQ